MLGTSTQTPETATLKSEVAAQFAALEARHERLISVVQELVEKPMRKAITGLDIGSFVGKPVGVGPTPAESLTKAEVTKRLMAKVSDPSLSKSDRELVNAFYDRQVGLTQIAHLLGTK
jgi:hypothetical protein